MSQCDTWGCDQEPTVIDQMGNDLCKECMDREVENGDSDYDQFETLTSDHEFG